MQVALPRGGRTDADALVGEADVHGVAVRGRVHGDCRDAELAAGPLHPQRDLAAVSDQDFAEHYSMTSSGCPYSTGWPLVTNTRVTVPARGALIWLNVFIASISITVCPAVTAWPGVTKGGLAGSGVRKATPTIGLVTAPAGGVSSAGAGAGA